MTRRWHLLVAVGGVAIFALSFLDGWIVVDRELRGEGYRHVLTTTSGWRGAGFPVLAAGAAIALATGAWSLLLVRAPGRPAWPLLAGSAAVLAVLLANAVPVAQDGHASSVDLSGGLFLPVGIVLAAGMLAGSVAVVQPAPQTALAAGALGVVILAGAAGGRWLGLQAGEGTGRHWSEGSYTRAATGGQPTESLTIGEGTFTIAERWGGRWEWSGWTVVLDGDPACPESRGTYHAHGVGDDDLRFVKVVDTCDDGARANDLEAGVWERDP